MSASRALLVGLALVVGCAGSSPAPPSPPPEKICGTAGVELTFNLAEDVASLAGCTHYLGSLRFGDSLFANVDGLESLREIDGQLNFFRNPNLVSLAGLRGLQRVGGNLLFNVNPKLADFQGLGALREVGGQLTLSGGTALVSLRGLEALRRVGRLIVSSNPVLGSLDGLAKLERVEGDLTITSNDSLSQAAAEKFAAGRVVLGVVLVSDNKP